MHTSRTSRTGPVHGRGWHSRGWHSRGRRAASAATVLATVAVLAAAAPAPAATTAAGRANLAGTAPAWATAQSDRGAAPSGTVLSVDVYLRGRDPAGLAAYAAAVSDPQNASYRKFLTPGAQEARFGPGAAQTAAVRGWLTTAGLRVTASTEQYVAAEGGPAAVQAAFGTAVHDYTVSGRTYYAPSAAASVPAALASSVLGVDGLSNRPRPAMAASLPAPSADPRRTTPIAGGSGSYIGIEPCAGYWGQTGPTDLPSAYGGEAPSPVCGYLPQQVRGAYGLGATGLTGKGQTIAIVDAYTTGTMQSDADTFATNHGLAPFRPGQYREVVDPSQWYDQSVCGGSWGAEQSLDVESAHTTAPDANIVYVGADACNDADMIAAFSDIVDNHLASIVSNSWDLDLFDTTGNEPQSSIDAYNQLMEQGAVVGIGFYFVTGDCSTDDPAIVQHGALCDPVSSEPQAVFPASSPWATALGATAMGIGRNGRAAWQTGMGDSIANLSGGTGWADLPGTFFFGSGGGTSDVYQQPSYQSGVVPASLSRHLLTGVTSAAPMRVVPDLAMEGDLYAATMTGYTQQLPDGTIGYGEVGRGGTSFAAPMFAGEQADAQQALGGALGFANPEIYLREKLLGSAAFTDVTDHPDGATEAVAIDLGVSGGLRSAQLVTLDADWTLHATPGFDDVTGIGSPAAGYLESFLRRQ